MRPSFPRLVVLFLALAAAACCTAPRPEPGTSEYAAIDAQGWAAIRAASDWGALMRAPREHLSVLCLSGGGQHGAFGAGLLRHWSRNGMPRCDVVTGVSTGALQATFAFLGTPEDCERLHQLYTSVGDDDLYRRNALWRLPWSSGVAVQDGLRALLERHLDAATIDRVAVESRAGRTLWIGTTNYDRGQFEAWNMTHIAAQAAAGNPAYYDLYRTIVLGSTCIPVLAEPVYLNGGMHGDGGVRHNAFLPGLARLAGGMETFVELYVVINGRLAPQESTIPNTLYCIGVRAMELVADENNLGSLRRIRSQLQDAAGDYHFHLAHIDQHFPAQPAAGVRFDTEYMRALARHGEEFLTTTGWHSHIELPEDEARADAP